MAGLVNSQHL